MQLRILLIRLSSLGDIILTMPLIAALREQYPNAVIELIVKQEYAELAKFFPGLSNVIGFDTKSDSVDSIKSRLSKNNYTHILDLHNNLRSKRLRKLSGATVSVINKRTFKRWLLVRFKINLLRDEPDVIGRYFETAEALNVVDKNTAPTFDIDLNNVMSNIAAICPGAKHWNKRWPEEHYVRLADWLIDEGYKIEFHGSSSEYELAERIATALPKYAVRNRCGQLRLEDLPEVFAETDIAFTNDSGLMHLASAAGCTTYSIFGPTVRELGFFPRSKKATVFENGALSCRPCTTIGLDHCPKKHFKCMIDVTAQIVIESFPKAEAE